MFELMFLTRAAVDEREREAAKHAWRWRLRETLLETAAREDRPPCESAPPARPARVIRCCGIGA